jgi:AcrR family transcriptional regulator
MGLTKRLRLKVDERRQRILAVAIGLFSSRAYEDIAIDDIAAQAGMSKGLLYHYFSTKRELYLATLQRVVAELRDETSPDWSLPWNERMHTNLRTFLNFIEQRPTLYISVLRGGVGADTEARAIVDQFIDVIVTRILTDAETSASTEILPLAAHGWVSLIIDVSLQWVSQYKEQIDKESVLELLERAFYALLPRTIQTVTGQA